MNVTNNEEILVVTLSTVLVLEDITCNWSILHSSTEECPFQTPFSEGMKDLLDVFRTCSEEVI